MRSSDKDPNKLRLQVFLSRNGVCSRRRAFDLVKEGKVTLNGRICREPSTPVDPDRDSVAVGQKRVHGKQYSYILLNKPKGYTTTKSDSHARKTVLELLPKKFHHLSPAGRLDRDSEGLLLLTNDGDAAYRLTHPKFNVDKTYFVRVQGRLLPDQKSRLETGLNIEGRKTAPAKITKTRFAKDQTELMITIHEGRKRQVRIMFAKCGHKVTYLKRVRQGPLSLGPMKTGSWRPLNGSEIKDLRSI